MVSAISFPKPASEDPALRRLLERCQKGDQRAWSELVDRFQRLVYSIPKRMGLSSDDSADVFQNTFLALYRSLDRIENAQTLPKWLSVTAARESLRVIRVNSVASHETELTLDQIVADQEQTAEETAVDAAQNEELWRQVDEMDGKCRDLLRSLYAPEPMPYEEIAETFKLPIGAIGPTRARCLEKLRKRLQTSSFFK